MWTPATRRQHSRKGLRYETDLTDAEWALIEPFMPAPNERTTAGMASARGDERDLLCGARRNRLASVTERSAAQEHGLWLVQPVARQRPVRDHQPHTLHGGSRTGWARSVALSRRHRQPEHQDHRERRAKRLRRRQEGERPQAAGPGRYRRTRPDPRAATR